MKVIEFINDFKEKKVMNTQINPMAVNEYIMKMLDVKKYIPFTEKRELCEKILNAACKRNGSIVEVDSVSRYILFTIGMLTKYTNLEFGNDDDLDSVDEYDMLCQNDLLNPILDVIGAEYTTCNNILNMMMADINANNNNSAAVFDKSAQKLLDIISELADTLVEKVESLNSDLSQIDIDKYTGLLEKLTQK